MSGSTEPMSYEEFSAMADRLGIDRDIREEIYPATRDLMLLTSMLNRLAPELSTEISVDDLTVGVSKGLR